MFFSFAETLRNEEKKRKEVRAEYVVSREM